jgi:hypothetical protein
MSAKQPGPQPKFNPLRWIEPSLNGLVTIALLMLAWFLATSETGRAFRENLAWYAKLGLAVLAGVLILAITHWFNIRARVEEQWLALAKTASAIAPSLVKPALLVLLSAILFTAYHIMKWRPEFHPEFSNGPKIAGVPLVLVGILSLASAPALLTLGVSLLVERRMARGDFGFEVNPALVSSRKHGEQIVQHARANWEYERELMEGAIHRMGRHAAILGFLASCILVTCTVLMYDADNHYIAYIAQAVGSAATISFTLHLGQIFFRSASNDATARMMARASRTLLIVSVCALFFSALIIASSPWKNDLPPTMPPALSEESPLTGTQSNKSESNPLQGRTGALLIGLGVALIGERMLRIVTNRAASILGLEGYASPEPGDLNVIDGLSEEDAARLAEERIDSIHALAFTPSARIFFNTVYGLPRICDWQDQALLIERVGRTNALLLREQFFIRGAIAARRFALQKFGAPEEKPQEGVKLPEKAAEAKKNPGPKAEEIPAPEVEKNPGTGASTEWLALDKESHLDRALRSLMDDENIEMLEVFWRSVPVLKDR